MKVKFINYAWDGSETKRGLASFIESELDGDREGQVETIDNSLDKTKFALGTLVEILTQKGILDKEDIKKIVNTYKDLDLVSE